MIAALVAGLLAGFGIAMPIGAVGAYLVTLTARTSLKIGAAAALGVGTADGLYALIAVVGGSSLTHVIEPVALPCAGSRRWCSSRWRFWVLPRQSAGTASGIRQSGPTEHPSAPRGPIWGCSE